MIRRYLPERPPCPGCHTQFAALVQHRAMSGTSDVVVVTLSCQHTVQGASQRRCGQPYAVFVVRDHAPRYLFADSFKQLEADILREIAALGHE